MRLDCRGLACPFPVVKTKKALEDMDSGCLECLVDTREAAENVGAYARRVGFDARIQAEGDAFKVLIDKTACAVSPPGGGCVYLLTGRRIGQGDPELGRALMATFLYTLTELESPPRCLIFMNEGVFLTTEGSEQVDVLKALEEAGAEVLSCGTCLDFYGLKERLCVGRVTNMYEISERVSLGNTVTL